MFRINLPLYLAFGAFVFITPGVFGHGTKPESVHQLLNSWEFDPGVVISIGILSVLYMRGIVMLRKAMPSGSIRNWEIGSFWLGIASLVFALMSPLHPWGRVLFAAHMTQHEILMLISAPFIVLGRPMLVCLKGLSPQINRNLLSAARIPAWNKFWRFVSHPFVAWLIHGIVLWIWHAPALFQATIDNDFIHALQHLSFFLSAVLFWWAVLHGREKRMGYGLAVLYMFATALHSGVLGALLTFTQKLWYPTYSQTTSPWGLSPMEDQQLGGLIMWVPAGLVYIAAGLALFAGWLAESEQRGYKFENKRSPSPAGAVSLLLCLMIPLLTGCGDSQTMKEVKIMTHGDPVVGKQTIKQAGCTACHTIPGIRDAHASVGPPLNQIANRTYIGGVLKNTPDNMIKWLLNPPAHAPKTAMPDLHLTEAQARDVAAYLYTLK